jgi:hypothetical protein
MTEIESFKNPKNQSQYITRGSIKNIKKSKSWDQRFLLESKNWTTLIMIARALER